MTLAEKAIEVAQFFVGVKEKTGKNDGGVVNFFQVYCADAMTLDHRDIAESDLLGSPWCAEFATSCIDIAAHLLGKTKELPVACSSSWLYAWAKKRGKLVPPKSGALGLLKGGPTGHQHTFLVISVDTGAGLVHSIDGNESNQVELTTHPLAQTDFVEIA